MDEPTTIDRVLMARDLELLSGLLAPAIEARLTVLNPILALPVIGPRLRNLLRDSPRQMTSEALGRILALPDPELVALVDGIGRELGAWRGMAPPLEPVDGPPLRAAYEQLLEAMDTHEAYDARGHLR